MVRETNALTVEQFNEVLLLLDTPYKEMALVAVMGSLNVDEICGLRWKRLNLTDKMGDLGRRSLASVDSSCL